ncbi:MH2 domain-containing protein [Caenorhabditis elegans]|nr:MH2 domain-containing protein [Caenorhabditis elegans]CCD73314.1 MH2 domain-containing protein [Caenorhabditis elegans]|eukprot:NP_001040865.1 Dwarfin sma-4 [Caenorhabditis elegans]
MDPHGENEGRLCLGALSNVHRTEASEKARIHIGRGVELTAHADGNISITSNCKIFVRSGYLDYTHGSEYSSKAHRFTPNESSFTVFDIRWAYMQMLRRSRSSNEAVRAQAAAVAGYAPMSVMPAIMPDSGVDRMRRDFCTIAISFVKAWGDVYQRKTIKETPCWIEVTLHRPLQILDQLLKNSSQFGSS